MDVRRLGGGERLAGISAVALFVLLFVHWYSRHQSKVAVDAWQAFSYVDLILLLVILSALAMVAAAAIGNAPALPVSLAVSTTFGGAFAVLLILYRIVNQPGDNSVVDVDAGAYLGLLAAVGIAVGGYRAMQEEAVTGAVDPGIRRRPAP